MVDIIFASATRARHGRDIGELTCQWVIAIVAVAYEDQDDDQDNDCNDDAHNDASIGRWESWGVRRNRTVIRRRN